jgi:hypothetical protein
VVAFWRNVEPLLKAGKTLIVSHHMRKPKSRRESQRDRASGSTDILAGTDSALAVQRAKPGVVRVECVKSREAEEAAGFVVRLVEESKDGPVQLVCDGASTEQSDPDSGKLAHAKGLVIDLLRMLPEWTAETEMIEGQLDADNIAKRTGQRALEELRKEGLVDQPTRGCWRLVKA